MIKNIPPSRQLLYILIFGLLPIAFSLLYLQTQLSDLSQAKSHLESLHESYTIHQKKQSSNQAIISHYKESDHFYIDKQLEALPLLTKEISALEEVKNSSDYAGSEAVEKRLEQLISENNILFSEGPVQSNEIYQETIETLVTPVEVDTTNLESLLNRIEQIVTTSNPLDKRPQIIILDFRLDRREPTPSHETFLLNLKLLKREYL